MSVVEFNDRVIQFTDSMKPIAINLTKDINDAQDLMQETLLKALSNREKFNDGTNLKAWIYTIMKNLFINNYRRKRKRNTIMDSTDNLFYLSGPSHEIPNDGENSLHVSDIQESINALSNDYKVPFLMHFEGYKYEEIAKKLKLPVGTVKSRIHLARKELKEDLKHYEKYQQ